MKMARRYVECFVFVAVWVSCGWLCRLSTEAYLVLGIPLLVFFQLAVARRPLSQLWVREAGAFRIDRLGAVVAAVLILVPVGALVKQHDSWERVLFYILAIIGAVPAAFALRQQRERRLRQALPAFAAAVAIGCVFFAVIVLQEGRSPLLRPTKLTSVGLTSLLLFPSMFLIEEVVFRGALDTHVALIPSDGKHNWVAAVFVSALWGLWHFPLNPSRTLSSFAILLAIHTVLGVPLSFCWRRSGTLVLPAAGHALIDAYRNVLFSV